MVLRALRSRNFRLYCAGQGFSLIGTWMQSVAMGWLVYRLTNREVLLGIVGFSSQIPGFFLSPFAGVWIDQLDRRKLLVATQSLLLLQALALGVLTLTGLIQVWHIVVLSVGLGLVSAFDIPGRQSFVIQMVDHREDLPNAIALNSTLFNTARLTGPAAAGVLIALVGEGPCFLLNAASYLAVIASLLAMRLPQAVPRGARRFVLHDMREGFAYAYRSVPMRAVLLLLALVSLFAAPYLTLMPVFAKQVLGGDARTQGFLVSSVGAGALVGALGLASRKSALGVERWLLRAAAILGIGLIGFACSRHQILSMACLTLVGFGMVTQMAASNTILQTLVSEDKRGRIMSLYTMAFLGTGPLGNLAGGALAEWTSAAVTVGLSGALCLCAAMVFASRVSDLRHALQQAVQDGPAPPDAVP